MNTNFKYIDGLLLDDDLAAAAAQVRRLAAPPREQVREEVDVMRVPTIARLFIALNSDAFIEKLREASGIDDLTWGNSYLSRYQPSASEPHWKSRSQGGRYGKLAVECEFFLDGAGTFQAKEGELEESAEIKAGRLFFFTRNPAVSFRRVVSAPAAAALVEYASKAWAPKPAEGAMKGLLLESGAW